MRRVGRDVDDGKSDTDGRALANNAFCRNGSAMDGVNAADEAQSQPGATGRVLPGSIMCFNEAKCRDEQAMQWLT